MIHPELAYLPAAWLATQANAVFNLYFLSGTGVSPVVSPKG